jgi:multidrug resistance efflux pump
MDSILFSKGAISKLEFINQKNNSINDKKSISETSSDYRRKLNVYKNLTNRHDENKNNIHRSIIEIDKQITEYAKEKLDLISDIENKKFNLDYISDELHKLVIISPINGTISNLFNTKQNIDIILKDDPLITLSPLKENYYAKITLPEKDLIYVKKNQMANLKIDAYNYYKYGAVKGEISYISPSDIEGDFYCLVDLKNHNKNIKLKAGYKFKGEIILEEMKMYEYIFKFLFNKIDENVNQ